MALKLLFPFNSLLRVSSTLSSSAQEGVFFTSRALATISAFGEVERKIADKLSEALKDAQSIAVKDTSGGCGSFYNIEIVATDFKGKSIIKQHQLVHDILKDEMTEWHGLNLTTKVPAS